MPRPNRYAGRRETAERSRIIGELSRLSRNSWANAKPCDYLPLEAALRRLEKQVKGNRVVRDPSDGSTR